MNRPSTCSAAKKARVGEALREAAARIAALPQASPRLEAELLLGDVTGRARTWLLAWPQAEIGEGDLARFRSLVRRRLAGEPIAYIRGHQAFWTLDLRVSAATLIPRPETEMLIELALEQLPARDPLMVLDAGCGSGAIAAALAVERPQWTLIATERSMGAALVARANLRLFAPNNAHLVNCDWLGPIAERSIHALISNPPYVADKDQHLGAGDLPREPQMALTAGRDGLDAIRTLSAQAATRLRPGGLIALEHGFDQGRTVRALLTGHGFRRLHTHRDLSGLDRATTGLLRD